MHLKKSLRKQGKNLQPNFKCTEEFKSSKKSFQKDLCFRVFIKLLSSCALEGIHWHNNYSSQLVSKPLFFKISEKKEMHFFLQYYLVICQSRWPNISAAVPPSSFPWQKTESLPSHNTLQGKPPQCLFRLRQPLFISAGDYSSCPSKAASHLHQLHTEDTQQLTHDGHMSSYSDSRHHHLISPFSLTLQQCSQFRAEQ